MEKALKKMIEEWDDVVFNTTPYRETGVSILSALDEIQTILDDQIVKAQTMKGSPFIKPFEEETKVRDKDKGFDLYILRFSHGKNVYF